MIITISNFMFVLQLQTKCRTYTIYMLIYLQLQVILVFQSQVELHNKMQLLQTIQFCAIHYIKDTWYTHRCWDLRTEQCSCGFVGLEYSLIRDSRTRLVLLLNCRVLMSKSSSTPQLRPLFRARRRPCYSCLCCKVHLLLSHPQNPLRGFTARCVNKPGSQS